MTTKANLYAAAGMLLAALANGFGQPVISTQPQSQTNVLGRMVTLSIEATGTPPLFYQWRRTGSILAGATNAELVFSSLQASNAGNYTVVVTNAEGSVTSAVAFVRVLLPPTITTQPASQTVESGSTVTFSVIATGTLPLSYQWRSNDLSMAGKTNTSLVLTNVQFTSASNYHVVITNVAGSVTSHIATLTIVPSFIKITAGSIVSDGGDSFSCAWGDYDGDGYEDLFVTNANGENNFLYRNNGDGTFIRVSIGSTRDCHSAAWGDYDNDGYLDLFVTGRNGEPNFLYRNMGNGSFTRVTNGAVATDVTLGFGTCWGDFDNDGFIDLFVASSALTQLNFAYKNNGDGTFARLTTGSLVEGVSSAGAGCMWGDYDNDGRLDLFVANCDFDNASHGGNDFLYRNSGGGMFVKISGVDPVIDDRHDVGCIWGDYDNDGFLDLFVSCGGPVFQEKNLLYHNNSGAGFERVTSSSMTTNIGYHTGCAWGDYDNDGFLDLFVGRANGQNNLLYDNNGDGTFTPVTTGSLVNDGGNSFGLALADYDNDGFLDLYVCNGGTGPPENNFLYRNNGNSNAWIKVKCIGVPSNRAAIGAKLRVRATIGGKTFWQLREISGGGSQGSQNSLIAHFGLGDATNADTVRIEWPSGTVQERYNVSANQLIIVIEPPRLQLTAKEPGGVARFAVRGAKGFTYILESSENLGTWVPLKTNTATAATLEFEDADAGNFTRRFYRIVLSSP